MCKARSAAARGNVTEYVKADILQSNHKMKLAVASDKRRASGAESERVLMSSVL